MFKATQTNDFVGAIKSLLFGSPIARERQETERLYSEVKKTFQASKLGDPKWQANLPELVVSRAYQNAGYDLDDVGFFLYNRLVAHVRRMVGYTGEFSLPQLESGTELSLEDGVYLRRRLQRLKAFSENFDSRLNDVLWPIAVPVQLMLAETPSHLIEMEEQEATGFSVPLIDLLEDPSVRLGEFVAAFFEEIVLANDDHQLMRRVLDSNAIAASGIDDPRRETKKKVLLPNQYAKKHADASMLDVADLYFDRTPIGTLFKESVPFEVPLEARFEHMHVVGGSGHGKTQLLQQFILDDLRRVRDDGASLFIIDSQGDMISTIMHLAEFDPGKQGSLSDRLVLIDPNDIDHPPCLNLFDVGLDRLDRYSRVEQEKLTNGAIALYEYIFGALLGADLTQRQSVIFRYLARLLMKVPGATIHTLIEFMQNPEGVEPFVQDLDGTARLFFQTQFQDKSFDDTRQQILTRLWGILSNPVLERMFSNRANKLDLFDALNDGKIVLVNTAKDLLKQDGCAILGRFFVALLSQAAQERAAIAADQRLATFVYIDEAQDYFDRSVELLLNQARKYRVGLTIAHQNLNQFEPDLLASVMASTAIKLAGGTSAKDAKAFSKEMRCEPEFIQSMRKRSKSTEFACFLKNVTPKPIRLAVPFGQMERRERLSHDAFDELIEHNRARYCAGGDDRFERNEPHASPKRPDGFALGDHELL